MYFLTLFLAKVSMSMIEWPKHSAFARASHEKSVAGVRNRVLCGANTCTMQKKNPTAKIYCVDVLFIIRFKHKSNIQTQHTPKITFCSPEKLHITHIIVQKKKKLRKDFCCDFSMVPHSQFQCKTTAFGEYNSLKY